MHKIFCNDAASTEKGKIIGIANVENALYKKALEGNVAAMKFYLCNRDKKNWQDCSKRSTDEQDQEPIIFNLNYGGKPED